MADIEFVGAKGVYQDTEQEIEAVGAKGVTQEQATPAAGGHGVISISLANHGGIAGQGGLAGQAGGLAG